VLLYAVLLALSPPATPGKQAVPSRFIHMEVLSLDALYDPSSPNFTTPRLFAIRVLKFSCSLDRVRFGLAPVEAGAFMSAGTQPVGLTTLLPVYVGYDLYRNPKKTLLCYSMVPDIYVEGTWFALPMDADQPCLRFMVNAEVEYFGLGAGLEAGYLVANQKNVGLVQVLGAGFRIRALVGNFALR
jgi:hypothetical protein